MVETGTKAPNFSLKNQDDKEVSLKDNKYYYKIITDSLLTKKQFIEEDEFDVDPSVERDGYGRKINLRPLDAFDKKRTGNGNCTLHN